MKNWLYRRTHRLRTACRMYLTKEEGEATTSDKVRGFVESPITWGGLGVLIGAALLSPTGFKVAFVTAAIFIYAEFLRRRFIKTVTGLIASLISAVIISCLVWWAIPKPPTIDEIATELAKKLMAQPSGNKSSSASRIAESVISKLPPYTRKTAMFYSFILFNSYDSTVPFVCANSMEILRSSGCADVRDIAKKNFRDSKESMAGFLASVLQHYLVSLLIMNEQSGYQMSPQPNRFSLRAVQPINTPEAAPYTVEQVLATMSPSDQRMFPWWFAGDARFRLPKGTQISFIGSPTTIHVARLQRPDCFVLDIQVTRLPPHEQGQLPENYKIGVVPDPSSTLVAYPFQIEISYEVQRESQDSDCKIEDYEQWANDLSAMFRTRLEN